MLQNKTQLKIINLYEIRLTMNNIIFLVVVHFTRENNTIFNVHFWVYLCKTNFKLN